MEQPVRVCMVGLGLAASAHVKGYAGHSGCRVAAVCDADSAQADSFAREHGVPIVYRSFDDVLGDRSVDAVDITTPTYLHAEMAAAAAAAGKHVLCEKPFCRGIEEGERVLRAAAESGVTLCVGETYVFITSHMKARQLVEDGAIGRPLQVRQRHGAWVPRPGARIYTGPSDRNWRVDPVKSGGGRFPWIFDHAVHFFAAAEYFMLGSPVSEVYAIPSLGRSEAGAQGAAGDPYAGIEVDVPLIAWKHEKPDCQGVWMRAERLNGRFDFMRGFSTAIIGERGMIEVLGEGGGNLFWDGAPRHLVLHREGKDAECFRFEEGGDDVWESEISYYSGGHARQVRHFVDCLRTGASPRYGGEDGLRAVRCTLAAIMSAEESRPIRVAEVPTEYRAFRQ